VDLLVLFNLEHPLTATAILLCPRSYEYFEVSVITSFIILY